MQTTKTPLILLALGLLSISLGAPAAHVYRTEGQAYQSCMSAIERQLPSRRPLEFASHYGLSEQSAGRVFDFYINVKKADPDTAERQSYRARCQARGFGLVDTVQVEAGSWVMNVAK